MPKGVFLSNDMITSDVFKMIKSLNTLRVLIEFHRRRVFHKRKNHKEPMLMNNGAIVLPYSYAKEKMGIPQTTFSRCLDELVELGFLDVEEMACGLLKMPTKWALSNRWRYFGTPHWKHVKRPHNKPPVARKGTKGQPFGRAKKKMSVTMNGTEKRNTLP